MSTGQWKSRSQNDGHASGMWSMSPVFRRFLIESNDSSCQVALLWYVSDLDAIFPLTDKISTENEFLVYPLNRPFKERDKTIMTAIFYLIGASEMEQYEQSPALFISSCPSIYWSLIQSYSLCLNLWPISMIGPISTPESQCEPYRVWSEISLVSKN